MKYRIAVLASGEGTNFQALVDKVHSPGGIELVLLVSNRTGAGALARAARAGIPALSLPPRPGEGRRDYHRRLARAIKESRPDLVVLAGYMRLLPGEFIRGLPPIINIHPSLLPAFPGLDAPAQAIAHGAEVSGCTVHLVDEGMDTGPVILQREVPVLPGDTPESLHDRIKEEEYEVLPQVCIAFAQGRISCRDGKIQVKEEFDEDQKGSAQRI